MPAAEFAVDEPLVRRLLVSQARTAIPDVATLPLRRAESGWDNELWRVGEHWAARLPRRAAAARLPLHEQQWLPGLAGAVTAASGLALPVPLVDGRPEGAYPWPWSVIPWTPGSSGITTARADRRAWAAPLARALRALHRPAPSDRPVNRYRGGPLLLRDEAIRERLRILRAGAEFTAIERDTAERAWDSALACPAWPEPDLWLHADLHPGNLLSRAHELVAIIDFGDLTGGDPAYDVAVAWLAFDPLARAEFRARYGERDPGLWTRARGWAAGVALLIAASDETDPRMRRMAHETVAEIGRELSP